MDEAIAAVAAAAAAFVKDIGKKSWVGPNSRPRVGWAWAPFSRLVKERLAS